MLKSLTIITALTFAAGFVLAQDRSQAQQFQEAINMMETKGNYPAAIRLFEEAAKGPDRVLAARSLYYVGQCYEKFGKDKALKAYERLIKRFADQQQVVAQARARLAALSPRGRASATAKTAGVMVRQVPIGPDIDTEGSSVSPDGRYLAVKDRETGNLIIQDLMTGEKRRLTNNTAKDEWLEEAIFSPDGKQIVYSWGIDKDKKTFWELRLIGIDGNGSRILYHSDEPAWIWPLDWSPDGKHILMDHFAKKAYPSGVASIALISVADGTARILKSLSFEKKPGIPDGLGRMRFSPDGRYIAYDYCPPNGSGQNDIAIIARDGSRDVPLLQSLANDSLLGWSPDGKSILFSSDRSKTIDAWIIPVADGKPQGTPELVKRGLGRVHPLGITRSGSFYYSHDEEARDIYIATLAPETGKLSGSPVLAKTRFTGSNTIPDWSPDGRYLVYKSFSGEYAEDPAGVSQIFILNPETGEGQEVRSKLKRFSSPRWFPDGKSFLVRDWTGPDVYNGGHTGAGLFKIDSETGDATLIAPEKPGSELLTPLLSRDGKAVFYQNKNVLWKRNLETGEDKEIYRPTPPTEGPAFTESLAVSPDGQRLALFLKQSLLLVPTTGGDARELLKLREPETFADFASNVAWTPDGRYLLFVKRNDMQSELWRIPVNGGEPQKLGQLMGRVSGLRVHPDGQHIAFNLWHWNKTEVWVMENFLPSAQKGKASTAKR